MCDEQPVFYTQSFPVARKQHRCAECGTPIMPGSQYFRYSGMWYGEIERYSVCAVCKWAISAMYQYSSDFCHEAGNLIDSVNDEIEWTLSPLEKGHPYRELLLVLRERAVSAAALNSEVR